MGRNAMNMRRSGMPGNRRPARATLACTVSLESPAYLATPATFWWPTSDWGTVSLISASVPDADSVRWTSGDASSTKEADTLEVSDPDGGNNACAVKDVNGVNGYHFLQCNTADSTTLLGQVVSIFDVWIRPRGAGVADYCRIETQSAKYSVYRFSTGAITNMGGNIGSVLSVSGDWVKVRVLHLGVAIATFPRVYCEVTPATQRLGVAGEGGYVYSPTWTQVRLANVADKIGAADMAQATVGNQRLFWTAASSLNGITTALQEAGRAASFASANAALVALLSTLQYAIVGVGRVATDGRIFRNVGAGTNIDELYRSGADMILSRIDGAAAAKTYTFAGAGTALNTAEAYALLSMPDGSVTLYVDGTAYAGAPAGAHGAIALTSGVFGGTGTAESEYADACLIDLAGYGGTAAALYTAVSPWVTRLKAKYNV